MKHYHECNCPACRKLKGKSGFGGLWLALLVLALLMAMFLLGGCASKTPPAFLQNASASMWGGTAAAPDGTAMLMAAPQQKRNGFDTFYGGGRQ